MNRACGGTRRARSPQASSSHNRVAATAPPQPCHTARHIAVAARASATRAAAAGSRSSLAGPVRGGASRCGCCCQRRRAVASFRGCLCKPVGARHGAASPRAAAQCPAPETRAPRGRRRAEVALALEQPPRKVPIRFLRTAQAEPPWARHSPSCCFRAASRPPHLQRWRWRAAARSSRRSAAYVASSTLSAPRGLRRERH